MLSRTLIAVSAILLVGTLYSVLSGSYLDTSDPLLTNLAHPLSKTHRFANKSNWLNTIFIKRSWGWTSAAFLSLWVTSPSSTTARGSRSTQRLAKYLTLTALWMLFTTWFFGPAVFDRVILATGGECVIALPPDVFLGTPTAATAARADASGQPQRALITVPIEFCHARTPLAPHTHPNLFVLPKQSTYTQGPPPTTESEGLTSAFLTQQLPHGWRGVPRLRRGHDVSGHVFLLTMSILFLADQLSFSFAKRLNSAGRVQAERWDLAHTAAVMFTLLLIALWYLGLGTTSVYFHSPSEKLTGYLLGVAAFAVTKLGLWERMFPQTTQHSVRAD